MAHHYTEFYKAVYDRFNADATLAGLIDGAWSARAPDTAKTYIVTGIEVASAETEGFRTLARDVRLVLTIINPLESIGLVGPVETQGLIAHRVEGNWVEKAAGVQPDYGLDRWQPSLPSWDCTPIHLESMQTVDVGDNRFAMDMVFQAHITKEAV